MGQDLGRRGWRCPKCHPLTLDSTSMSGERTGTAKCTAIFKGGQFLLHMDGRAQSLGLPGGGILNPHPSSSQVHLSAGTGSGLPWLLSTKLGLCLSLGGWRWPVALAHLKRMQLPRQQGSGLASSLCPQKVTGARRICRINAEQSLACVSRMVSKLGTAPVPSSRHLLPSTARNGPLRTRHQSPLALDLLSNRRGSF